MAKEQVRVDPRNTRAHPQRNMEAVEKSLKELGAGRSIVVDRDGYVIGGNAVYEKAKKLGLKIKEVETDGSELVVVRRLDLSFDDPRRKALAVADNQIALLAEWDIPALAEVLADIEQVQDLDVTVTGFSTEELDPLLKANFDPGEFDPDAGNVDKEPRKVVCPKCGYEFEIE